MSALPAENCMPRFARIPGGGIAFIHPCFECGAEGSIGEHCDLKRAITEKNPALAGRWYCGRCYSGRGD